MPSRRDWRIAREIYADYSRRSGSLHIAEEAALAHLAWVLRTRKPRSVVEIGGGIGTMTALILRHPVQALWTVEAHPFCQNILTEMMLDDERLVVLADAAALRTPADLVLIDGEGDCAHFLAPGSTVFVEGKRPKQREALTAAMADRGWTLSLREYGTQSILLWSRDWLPRPIGFQEVRKGCWIGTVKETT